MAAEMDRRVDEEQPATWSDLVSLGLGVSRAVLAVEPRLDPRPWARGCELELCSFDQEVSRASLRKRKAEDWDEWKVSVGTFVAGTVVVLLGLGLRRLHGGIRRPNRCRIRPTKEMPLVFLPLLRSSGIVAFLSLWARFVRRMPLLNGMPGRNIFVYWGGPRFGG